MKKNEPKHFFFAVVVFLGAQNCHEEKQEAQGLGALLEKMEDNDHIKLDNIEI